MPSPSSLTESRSSVVVRLDAELDGASVRRVLDGVVDEVDQDLPELVLVATTTSPGLPGHELERDVVAIGEDLAHLLDDLTRESDDVDVRGRAAGGRSRGCSRAGCRRRSA